MFLNESLGYTETENWYGHSGCSMLQRAIFCKQKRILPTKMIVEVLLHHHEPLRKGPSRSLTAFSFYLFEAMAGQL